jgi:hypothetical protein
VLIGFPVAPDQSSAVEAKAIPSQEKHEASGAIGDKAATTTADLTWNDAMTPTDLERTDPRLQYKFLRETPTQSAGQRHSIGSGVSAANANTTRSVAKPNTGSGTVGAPREDNRALAEGVTPQTNALPSQGITTAPPRSSDRQVTDTAGGDLLAAENSLAYVSSTVFQSVEAMGQVRPIIPVAPVASVDVGPRFPRNEQTPLPLVRNTTQASQMMPRATVNSSPMPSLVPERRPYPSPKSTPLVEAENSQVSHNSSLLRVEGQGGNIPQIAQGAVNLAHLQATRMNAGANQIEPAGVAIHSRGAAPGVSSAGYHDVRKTPRDSPHQALTRMASQPIAQHSEGGLATLIASHGTPPLPILPPRPSQFWQTVL